VNKESVRPFEGLKVLELASVLAGPLAGSFLAEGGASVIKVEHPLGDVTRSWRSEGELKDDPNSAYFAAANTFKKVIKKDLASEEGLQWLENELSNCDILLQNFKESDLNKFDLLPEKLAKKFPNIIHIRLVGFAESPERLAYDVVMQAETGFMYMNGSSENRGVKIPVAIIDILASHQIRSAVTTGLYARERGATGWYAQVSLELSGIAALVNQATNYLMNDSIPQRIGSLHPNIAPYGEHLELADGDIVLAIGSDAQFISLCKVLGNPELSKNSRYLTNQDRVVNRKELIYELQKLVNGMQRESLLQKFHESRVPAGGIRTLDEVFAPGTPGSKAVIKEETENSTRTIIKPRTTAYSVTIFGNEIL
jgi:crotonobetainyl-CoA:carnitine CoA-transferase CaiB-like acyl-CoA transferase